MSDKHQEWLDRKKEEKEDWEVWMQHEKIDLFKHQSKQLDIIIGLLREISSNLTLVKVQDARINDLNFQVAGLNRTITFLKNTGKFPKEEK